MIDSGTEVVANSSTSLKHSALQARSEVECMGVFHSYREHSHFGP